MPSGSKKKSYKSEEQYQRQLEHSRAWKRRNREHLKEYHRNYIRPKRPKDGSSDKEPGHRDNSRDLPDE